jgi:AraC-like DNA-binding protein
MSDTNISQPPAAMYAVHQAFERIDSGWRTFPQHYLLYASSGTFRLEVERTQWLLPPQRAAWIAADLPIRVQATAPVTCASVLFAPAMLPEFDYTCRVFTVSPLAREMVRHAMRWGPQRPPDSGTAQTFFLALAAVCCELAQQPDRSWLPRAQSAELARATAYALDHMADDLSLAAIAEVAVVSERTLARRFADEMQMTWRQFLRRARMIRALELLARPEVKVLDVVYATGFESASAFSATFRSFTGETPAAYRQRIQSTVEVPQR